MIEIKDKSACCGCGACGQICPKGCIRLEPDAEGFLYPSFDAEACVGCGLCERVCPMLHPERVEDAPVREARGLVHRDREVHRRSSSGGVFTALAEQVLSQGGCVYGAAFSPDFRRVAHVRIERAEELPRLRGSKYLQSEIGGCYAAAKADLLAGRPVLFTGTPCQIAGLKGFLGKPFEGLVCVDLFCHGTPSPLLWERYLRHVEDGLGGKAASVDFRHKESGAQSPVPAGEARYYRGRKQDPYLKMFLTDLCLRESCYRCSVKEGGFVSDLSLGDFWGVERVAPELDDPLGVSLVLVHTEKGRALLDAVLPVLDGAPVDFDAAIAGNAAMNRSVARPPERDVFFDDLRRLDWPRMADKYAQVPLKTRLRNSLSDSFVGDLKRSLRSGGAAPAKKPSLQYGVMITAKKK